LNQPSQKFVGQLTWPKGRFKTGLKICAGKNVEIYYFLIHQFKA